MSRIGRQPIKIPSGVNVSLSDDDIKVDGTKGSLSQFMMPNISVVKEGEEIVVSRANEEPESRSKHGLMRTLIDNMIIGVTKGFEKKLEVNGVGYRVALAGKDLKLSLGFSHEVIYNIPDDITAQVNQNAITISGISKQRVGQIAAEIRALKKPEPYKGKGIKYDDEKIIRKSGKSGKEK